MLILNRRSLPHAHGLYGVLTGDGRLLRIGATRNLHRRWYSQELLRQCWGAGGRQIAYTDSVDLRLIWMVEHALIRYHRPPLNGHHQARP